jgi:aspartyl protease family protein
VAGLAVARRVPVLRTVVSLASWLVLAGLLVLLLDRRAAFDPYLGRIAGLLRLDRQEVVGEETRVRLSPDGHYWVRATINGVSRRLLVDSGATVTALDPGTAAAAGLEVRRGPVPVLLRTANGTVAAAAATVAELRLGNIVARDVPVVVSPALGDMSLVGMNFLSRLQGWRVEKGELILTPHHPQRPAGG